MMTKAITLKKDQVYNLLKEKIQNGQLSVGKKMPSELVLAKELGVGKITLRAALTRLNHNGFIERIHGRGTFITSQIKNPIINGTIMVIHSTVSNFESSWHYIVPAINRFAQQHNLKIFTMTVLAFELFSDSDIKTFVTRNNVIGIISTMNNFNGDETIIDKLKAVDVPVILAHARVNDSAITGFASIVVDEKAGWETAIRHLTEQGHSNIAVIGSDGSSPFRDATMKETIASLTAYGANPNPELFCQVHFDKSAISGAVKKLLSVSPAPTAFLCYSDFYAVYVYEILAKLNLNIPTDIAVMGICGLPDAKLLTPPLSTIDYGYGDFAKIAVEMVMEPAAWFEPKTGKGKRRMKPFELKARKSSKKTAVIIDRKISYVALPSESLMYA